MEDANVSGRVIMEDVGGAAFLGSYVELSQHGNSRLGRVRRYDRFYFVKSLRPDLKDSAALRRQLRKEFDLMLKAEGEAAVRAIEMLHTDELGDAILMEYVAGQTLAEWLKGKPKLRERKDVAGQMVEAVARLHRLGIVHRDLKPENIMITNEGHRLKIIDFGLADSPDSAVMKRVGGNESYSAPELLAGTEGSAASDVYSLGRLIADLRPGIVWLLTARKGASRKASGRYPDAGAMLVGYRRIRLISRVALPVVIMALIAPVMIFNSHRPPESGAPAPALHQSSGKAPASDVVAVSPASPVETGEGQDTSMRHPGRPAQPYVSAPEARMERPEAKEERSQSESGDPIEEFLGWNDSHFHPSLSGMELPDEGKYEYTNMYAIRSDMRRLPGYHKYTPQEVYEAYRRDFEKAKKRIRKEGVDPSKDRALHMMYWFYGIGFAEAWITSAHKYQNLYDNEYVPLIRSMRDEHARLITPLP